MRSGGDPSGEAAEGRRDPDGRESSGKAQGGTTAPEVARLRPVIQGSGGATDGAQDGRIQAEDGIG